MIARVAEVLTCERFTSSDTRPLTLAPPGRCEACGCRLSVYRQADEILCAPCAPNGGVQESGSGKAQNGSVPAAILEALRAGPMSRADISTLTGCRTSSVKAALRVLVAHNRGAIINVASVAAFAQRAGSASYGATKSWLTSFTEGLYLDLKKAKSAVL